MKKVEPVALRLITAVRWLGRYNRIPHLQKGESSYSTSSTDEPGVGKDATKKRADSSRPKLAHIKQRAGGEMSLKHLTIGAVVVACTFVTPAAAQRNELSGILGRTFISDQGIQGAPAYDPNLRFGKGLTFEINYAPGLIGGDVVSLSLEVPVLANPNEDLHAAQNLI